MNTTGKTIIWVTLFAVAMGYMESSVVVYLRELYYKNGFSFPLKEIPFHIARIEFFREVATLIMLVGCGIIAGKTPLQRFSYFLLAFAVWDLCYYIFLYVCLGWPQTLNTWDILFLIPVPWIGPVWAPCLLSLSMILFSGFTIYKTERNREFTIALFNWFILILGVITCVTAFMWDYLREMRNTGSAWTINSTDHLFKEISAFVPQQFNTGLFLTGYLLLTSSFLFIILKSNKK
jgi:hypothetical protein